MPFIDWIIERLRALSDWFWEWYLQLNDWGWPFDLAAPLLYYIQRELWYLSYDFRDLGNWIDNTQALVQNILSWSSITSLIRSWLTGIESLISWFSNWWGSVWNVIQSWWPTVWPTIQGAIDAAIAGLGGAWENWLYFWNNLWPALTNSFNNLKAAFDNFWTVTFPTLVSFTWLTTWWTSTMGEVLGLIDTAFALRDSLWAGWQEIRDQVLEFFSDPQQWVYDRMDEFFERFW